MRQPGARLTPEQVTTLPIGTELLYDDRRPSSGSTRRRVKVKRYQQVGAVMVLVVELEDGSLRSPSPFSLYWPK